MLQLSRLINTSLVKTTTNLERVALVGVVDAWSGVVDSLPPGPTEIRSRKW